MNETHLVTFEPETTGRPTYMIPLEIILHVDVRLAFTQDKNVEFRSIFVYFSTYLENCDS